MKPLRLTEQVDKTEDGLIYSWILDHVPPKARKHLEELGWKWVRGVGCPGSLVTKDRALALWTADRLELAPPVSNGTHASVCAPMSLPDQWATEVMEAELQRRTMRESQP
jgi:hypothetical protein